MQLIIRKSTQKQINASNQPINAIDYSKIPVPNKPKTFDFLECQYAWNDPGIFLLNAALTKHLDYCSSKSTASLERAPRLWTLDTVCFPAVICPSRLLFSSRRTRSCWLQVCQTLAVMLWGATKGVDYHAHPICCGSCSSLSKLFPRHPKNTKDRIALKALKMGSQNRSKMPKNRVPNQNVSFLLLPWFPGMLPKCQNCSSRNQYQGTGPWL